MSSPSAKASEPCANVAHFPIERMGDAELLQLANHGDHRAIGAIWDRYAQIVRHVLFATLGPDHCIEDLLQEVFIALLRGAERIEQGNALRGYLTSVAVRQAAQELRRRKVRRWVTLTPTGQLPDAPAMPGDSEGREALHALYRVLDKLGNRERLVFVLRHIEGMEFLEIVRTLGISESTVRRSLTSARDQLERSLRREPALRAYLQSDRGEQP